MPRVAESRARTRLALVVEKECLEDLRHWVQSDRRVALKALELIESVMRDPFSGGGKPEPLKHMGGSVWSRRITREDRLVYKIYPDRIVFLMARSHY